MQGLRVYGFLLSYTVFSSLVHLTGSNNKEITPEASPAPSPAEPGSGDAWKNKFPTAEVFVTRNQKRLVLYKRSQTSQAAFLAEIRRHQKWIMARDVKRAERKHRMSVRQNKSLLEGQKKLLLAQTD